MAKKRLTEEEKEIFLQKISNILFISDLRDLANQLEVSLENDSENIIEGIDFSQIREKEITSLIKKITVEIRSRKDEMEEDRNFDY